MPDDSFKSGKPTANVANPAKDWGAPLPTIPRWVDISGWGTMPDPNIAKVKAVLENNFTACKPSEEDLEYGAESIVLGMYDGLALIRRDKISASDTATENELRKLQSLCIALDDHIASLRRPAYLALHAQGIDPTKLQNSIRDVANNCAAAWDDAEKGLTVGGRPLGHVATEVTTLAAIVFERFTNTIPTFVTDPNTNGIRGLWPSTVEAIFQALEIEASVEACIRKHAREKTAAKKSK